MTRVVIYNILSLSFMYPCGDLFKLIHIPVSLEELQKEYNLLFGTTKESLYGTECNSGSIFQKSQSLSDICGFYNAFGVQLSSSLKERADFLPVMLEFMGFLIQKEEYARKNHGKDEIEICLNAQRKFLKEYLLPWIPIFAANLKEKAKKGFYCSLAELLDTFIANEGNRLLNGSYKTGVY